jgi:hypothetical protein
MKLIFQNSHGVERIIAFPKDEEEAMKEIYKFCEERNFKIYYVRTWMENNRKKYDVGSHTEFFYLEAMEGLV